MKNIIYLNEELDINEEHELFATNLKGFNVKYKFSKEGTFSDVTDIQEISNVTEVHINYNSIFGNNLRIAFESNIHRTGCTYLMSDIEEVEINLEIDFSHE